MKTKFYLVSTILAGFLSVAGHRVALAQCDKTVTLTASSTNYLDDKGTITRTVDEGVVITVTKTDLTIVPGNDHELGGKITSYTCDWKVPYKEGRSVIKATVSKDGTNEMHATVTIEGKDGKVTLTFEVEERVGRKIQVVADKFE
ncbi:hypothetical protein GWR56_09065 [Mucilaginibacter sp. 14171R-50]|uniref:hypothetical protein n=1 Tax=Mucilaginibacter sp. 14171R-50 TaxID=2703789 RepID=UPI00138D78DE|nr:hypothetical protein [Mucilaginibacter sp. 14171R-50]QHS55681.1 hypothetical protein GWR56_09065 [Mucilaginibacter sp. 14171R-50]